MEEMERVGGRVSSHAVASRPRPALPAPAQALHTHPGARHTACACNLPCAWPHPHRLSTSPPCRRRTWREARPPAAGRASAGTSCVKMCGGGAVR